MSENNNSSSGAGFAGLLTVLFIGLKLTGHVEWTWLWVLSPMWISTCFGVAGLAIIFTVAWVKNRK